jgi:hypothetical protein
MVGSGWSNEISTKRAVCREESQVDTVVGGAMVLFLKEQYAKERPPRIGKYLAIT